MRLSRSEMLPITTNYFKWYCNWFWSDLLVYRTLKTLCFKTTLFGNIPFPNGRFVWCWLWVRFAFFELTNWKTNASLQGAVHLQIRTTVDVTKLTYTSMQKLGQQNPIVKQTYNPLNPSEIDVIPYTYPFRGECNLPPFKDHFFP